MLFLFNSMRISESIVRLSKNKNFLLHQIFKHMHEALRPCLVHPRDLTVVPPFHDKWRDLQASSTVHALLLSSAYSFFRPTVHACDTLASWALFTKKNFAKFIRFLVTSNI